MIDEHKEHLNTIANGESWKLGPKLTAEAVFAAALIELAERVEEHSLSLLERDGGPDPIGPPSTAEAQWIATATGTTISSRSAICSAAPVATAVGSATYSYPMPTASGANSYGNAVDNEGTIDVRTGVRPTMSPSRFKSFPQQKREEQEAENRRWRRILDRIQVQPERPYHSDEVLIAADLFAPHLNLQPGQLVRFGDVSVRVTEPDDPVSEREEDREAPPALEPQSRVRVRDELAEIIENWNLLDHPSTPVDSILDKLRERLWEHGRSGHGFIDDVKAGRL